MPKTTITTKFTHFTRLLQLSFLILPLISLHNHLSDACFASGICGGGVGCLPPPPPPCIPAQCGAGYGCGQYGCYRLRARVASSRTLKINSKDLEVNKSILMTIKFFVYMQGGDDEHENRPLDSPDARFMACCQARQLVKYDLTNASASAHLSRLLGNRFRTCTSVWIHAQCNAAHATNMKGCFWHDLKRRLEQRYHAQKNA
uniref:DB domain-containing protein n=1 Tax=Meloidogyne hapla TaxID=6305 RepID=A0A1I8BY82_MELHA